MIVSDNRFHVVTNQTTEYTYMVCKQIIPELAMVVWHVWYGSIMQGQFTVKLFLLLKFVKDAGSWGPRSSPICYCITLLLFHLSSMKWMSWCGSRWLKVILVIFVPVWTPRKCCKAGLNLVIVLPTPLIIWQWCWMILLYQ